MAPSPDPLQQPGSSASQRAKRNRSEFPTCIGSKGPAATLSLQKGDLQPVLEDKFLPAWKPSLCLVSLWVMKLWMRAFALCPARDRVLLVETSEYHSLSVEPSCLCLMVLQSLVARLPSLELLGPYDHSADQIRLQLAHGDPKQMPQIARP